MPVVTKFSEDKYFPNRDVTLSQSFNLANLRIRYFDTTAPNIIKTTINTNNPPIYDNIMMLIVDQNTISQMTSGSLVTFTNPDNINDINMTGASVTNQFGSNSITGSTQASTTVPITYINQNGNPQTVQVQITGNTDGKEYLYKTGIEYFQVVTGMTLNNLDLQTNGIKLNNQPNPNSQLDTTNIIRKYILNKLQRITYEDNSGSGDNGQFRNEVINPLTIMGDSWKNLEIVFLVRGVDPYTDTQNIEYDLSRLFGYSFGQGPKVSGQFYMNIPIQPNSGSGAWWYDSKTPESHNVTYPTSKLYHQTFNFNTGTQFSSVTSNNIRYYSSLDKSTNTITANGGLSLSTYTNSGLGINDNGNGTQQIRFYGTSYQGRVEGGALMASSNSVSNNTITSFSNYNGRLYSPVYGSISYTIPSGANPKLLLRSDRLPTSDVQQTFGTRSMLLHQNDKFAIYIYNSSGPSTLFSVTATDTTNNAQDFGPDGPQTTASSVLSTFDCAGMVPLDCYQVDTTTNTFSVLSPCTQNQDPVRIKSGCYQFIQKPYVANITKDLENFSEWKARFRMMFGACRGIFSHVFQNNWVNGTLYMFSFKKQTIVSILGQPKKYKYCGTYESNVRPGQGPIYYTSGSTNSFFYRSTPYNGTNFVGQIPKQGSYLNPAPVPVDFGGANDRNIMFPTTIMDLGPRDEFSFEICANPNLQGYLVDTLKSTSFNDTSDLLQLFIISRLINTNFLGALLGLGDASINKMFSRSDDRLDGDLTQLFSINSEYGVEGFSEDEYDGVNDIYIATSGPATLGVFFTSSTENRVELSPGVTTFTPQLTNLFGYPGTQEVPFYQWQLNQQQVPTIFGSDINDWNTNLIGGGFYKQKYQGLSFKYSSLSQYFNNLTTGQKGFIYNSNASGNDVTFPAGQSNSFLVGAPYHFYFGLNKGKSSINRYITKYILNQDV
jgi:hypothetical protein